MRLAVRTIRYYLRQIWEEERSKLFARLKQNGQIDLLDHHLGANGLDLITAHRNNLEAILTRIVFSRSNLTCGGTP